MKKHYETHVEDTDKLISVAGPILEYKSWYEQYRKLMEEQAQRKCGLYTPTSEGDDDDFPSITGMIARYSALGLTNEQMTENPVWKDLTGNGHDLQMKNFAWKGMSGVGGYVTNKEVYEYDLNKYSYVFIPSESKVHDFYVVFELTGYDESFEDGFNLDVRSTTQSLKKRVTYTKNGIYTFQYKDEEGLDNLLLVGYNGNGGARSNFTVKILPPYPGALVFDGVDDYGTCDNFPILTKEKGYTVVALRQYLVEKSTAYLTANGDSISNTSFIFEGNNYKDTWNFGKATAIQASRILATQTSKQYDGVKLNIGTNAEGSNLLQVGKWSKSYSNVAIWELVFLDHDATEEELTKIKDYFVKTYPWLFPYQAWTVAGKTNEDEDRATIANITGNGNDLVLSNFGFAEGSGYNEEGEYAGYLVTDGVDDKIGSSIFKLGKDFTVVGEWKYLQDISNNSGLRKISSFIIRNNASGLSLFINRTSQATTVFNVKSLKAFCSNGLLVKNDWTEQIDTVSQFVTSSNSKLSIACRDDGVTEYDKFAFKNLAIYPMVLSKDDYIKAYNYLQTLKAK